MGEGEEEGGRGIHAWVVTRIYGGCGVVRFLRGLPRLVEKKKDDATTGTIQRELLEGKLKSD